MISKTAASKTPQLKTIAFLILASWTAQPSLGTVKELIKKILHVNQWQKSNYDVKPSVKDALILIQEHKIQDYKPMGEFETDQELLVHAYPIQPQEDSKNFISNSKFAKPCPDANSQTDVKTFTRNGTTLVVCN